MKFASRPLTARRWFNVLFGWSARWSKSATGTEWRFVNAINSRNASTANRLPHLVRRTEFPQVLVHVRNGSAGLAVAMTRIRDFIGEAMK